MANLHSALVYTHYTHKASPIQSFGDKFGESLGGSQAPRSFWNVPGLPQKFPELPPEDFSLWNLTAIDGFPGSFPDFPGSSPDVPRSFPGLPRRSAPFSGKPDTLSSLAKTFSIFANPPPAGSGLLFQLLEPPPPGFFWLKVKC